MVLLDVARIGVPPRQRMLLKAGTWEEFSAIGDALGLLDVVL
jgi:hypothetical protein